MKTMSSIIIAAFLFVSTMTFGQGYSVSDKEIDSKSKYRFETGVAVGATDAGDMTYRFSITSPWNVNWLGSSVGHITGFWDLGYTYWQGGNKAAGNHSLSFAPVFVYRFNPNGEIKPYIEAGVGIAGFSRTRVSNKKLGSSFNFEDRIGFGIEFLDRQKLGLRVIHYSNAGIKRPNQGINSYSLFYSYGF